MWGYVDWMFEIWTSPDFRQLSGASLEGLRLTVVFKTTFCFMYSCLSGFRHSTLLINSVNCQNIWILSQSEYQYFWFSDKFNVCNPNKRKPDFRHYTKVSEIRTVNQTSEFQRHNMYAWRLFCIKNVDLIKKCSNWKGSN